MPTVTSGLILVTGASGFVGTHTVEALLAAGYKVRGVVRSDAKGKYLQSLYKGVDYTVVPDMNVPGCYNDAVVGVDAVIHTASPLDTQNEGDPANVIGPAVAGVTGILDSLEKFGNAKRIVTLSSIAAVGTGPSAGEDTATLGRVTVTEADWNDKVVHECEQLGAAAPGHAKYSASKTLAERAFWKFFADNQPKFDGVALNPAYIFGPPSQFTSDGGIVGSNALFLTFLKPGFPDAALSKDFTGSIDVRDVALAAVKALATPQAAGERYLLIESNLFANDFALAAGKALPTSDVNKGNPDPAFRAALQAKAPVFDRSKTAKAFGIRYHPKDATLEETAKAIALKL